MRNSSSLVLLKMNFLNSEASVRVAGATQRVSF